MQAPELSLPADRQRLPTPEEVALLQRIWRLYRFGVPDLSEKGESEAPAALSICGYLSVL